MNNNMEDDWIKEVLVNLGPIVTTCLCVLELWLVIGDSTIWMKLLPIITPIIIGIVWFTLNRYKNIYIIEFLLRPSVVIVRMCIFSTIAMIVDFPSFQNNLAFILFYTIGAISAYKFIEKL